MINCLFRMLSLPSDVEEAELGENLANHLGRTANIQSIKIIHDSKGGVCAFVQCEVIIHPFLF